MNATSFLDTQINLSPSGANLSRSKPWLAKNLRFAIDKCPAGNTWGRRRFSASAHLSIGD